MSNEGGFPIWMKEDNLTQEVLVLSSQYAQLIAPMTSGRREAIYHIGVTNGISNCGRIRFGQGLSLGNATARFERQIGSWTNDTSVASNLPPSEIHIGKEDVEHRILTLEEGMGFYGESDFSGPHVEIWHEPLEMVH